MKDPKSADTESLYARVAKKVVTESLQLRKGENLTVETWNNGLGFARQIIKEARRIGAIPVMLFEDEDAFTFGVSAAPKDMVGVMGKHEHALLAETDAYVFIPGPPAGGFTKKLSEKVYPDSIRYNRSWYDSAKKARLRGVRMTFGYVGSFLSELLGKEAQDVVAHQLQACLTDFREIRKRGIRLAKHLPEEAEATLKHRGATLHFRLKGETEIQDGVTDSADVEDGNNMAYLPPGFLVREIDPSSLSGTVKISPSISRLGMVGTATIELEEGKISRYLGSAGSRTLERIFEIVSRTGRKFSYFTIGLNPTMQYGYAQDRFPEGAISLDLGFSAILREGDLSVNGKGIIRHGLLSL